jgi:hypothetical protein
MSRNASRLGQMFAFAIQVSQLIEGFESPYGLEPLATVHWVADRQGAKTVEQAIEKVHGWSTRKTMFTPYQIQAAWDRLLRLGWLDGLAHTEG